MNNQFLVRYPLSYLAITFVVLLSGCTGSQVLVEQKYTAQAGEQFDLEVANSAAVPENELAMLKQLLDGGLRERHLRGDKPTRVLKVTVTKYHFRSETTRALTGNLTGNDAIVSTITIKRSADGEILGREDVITHNPTVISTEDQLIKAHANKILNSLVK